MAVATLAACGGGDDDDAGADFTGAADGPSFDAEPEMVEIGDAGDSAENTVPAAVPGQAGSGDFDLGTIGRDVIVEMRVSMTSDDVQRTVAAITAHASGLGGGIASSEIDYGDEPPADADPASDPAPRRGFAVLVVKVPPSGVDQLLAGLDDSGSVSSINQSAQDVTEQLVNLDVRIQNAQESVENVRGFMEQATDLTDLVTLESELTRRQTELEVLEAQERNISDRVALSTVTIEVRSTTGTATQPADDSESIGDAFREGWEAFAGVLFGIGFLLAVLSPFMLVGAIIAGVGWMLTRNRRSAITRDDAPMGPPTGGPVADRSEQRDELVTSTPPE